MGGVSGIGVSVRRATMDAAMRGAQGEAAA
jgi:hypothetical protein